MHFDRMFDAYTYQHIRVKLLHRLQEQLSYEVRGLQGPLTYEHALNTFHTRLKQQLIKDLYAIK